MTCKIDQTYQLQRGKLKLKTTWNETKKLG